MVYNMNYEELIKLFEEEEVVEVKLRPELLLHPNVPKPLHGLAPRVLKGKVWWDVERKKAYARNNYHCMACGVNAPWDDTNERFATEQKLHAHESYDIDYSSHTAELVEIVAICPMCHDYIHSGRTNALYSKGRLDEEDCFYIFTHGDSILVDCGICPSVKRVDTNSYRTEWSKWKLILEGKEYFSKFKSFDKWREHYK